MLADLNRALAGFVELHRDGPILEIRMVKTPVNAICRRFSRGLEQAALYLQNEPELRVGLLTSGCEKAFSAGLDFRQSTAPAGAPREPGAQEGGFGGITTLWSLKKPLIAVIAAPAIGGGLELALACDIILMADEAYLRLPELERGLIPDGGGLQRLPRRIPYHVATAMIWTGEPMSAADALRWGLAYRTAPRDRIDAVAREVARRVARGAPLAQQALKEALRAVDGLPDRQAMAMRGLPGADLTVFERMLKSDDMIEGQRAFLERRAPRWTGQ
ncbi:enoyl-CoA hydratase-related protein [Prosthecodimorpha staleyi]|uniref:Enoyl-CoA hydratase/isomerase family protein n=1 Tax=Prosthecodimorpha staleyi TaxID=2840188 RepID=A0A947GEV0_9HYPH|nr:enoyl-CoA hydratase-related protein [Prosthecodimorpha staleyi]MBT9289805.1 enoyl-CoA hydratase/isomerase family protein [Prosthecodimorpha staleyi]